LVWHGREYKATRVRLNADLRRTERLLRGLKEACGAEASPKLALKDHCRGCGVRHRGHAQAGEGERLSLLRGLGGKGVANLNKKGIFTVTQYSYTFRPGGKGRRRRPRPASIFTRSRRWPSGRTRFSWRRSRTCRPPRPLYISTWRGCRTWTATT